LIEKAAEVGHGVEKSAANHAATKPLQRLQYGHKTNEASTEIEEGTHHRLYRTAIRLSPTDGKSL
jgi:hypothetical protein